MTGKKLIIFRLIYFFFVLAFFTLIAFSVYKTAAPSFGHYNPSISGNFVSGFVKKIYTQDEKHSLNSYFISSVMDDHEVFVVIEVENREKTVVFDVDTLYSDSETVICYYIQRNGYIEVRTDSESYVTRVLMCVSGKQYVQEVTRVLFDFYEPAFIPLILFFCTYILLSIFRYRCIISMVSRKKGKIALFLTLTITLFLVCYLSYISILLPYFLESLPKGHI